MTTQELNLIENESKSVSEQVKSLTIIDQSSYEKAATIKISLSALRKKIKIYWEPLVAKAKESYDGLRAEKDKFLKPVVDIEETLKMKLKSYERKKEQEAEEARRKAEEERQKKIDEENERRRKEAEQKAKDEAEVLGVPESEVEVDKIKEVKLEDVEVEQPLPTIDRIKGLGIRKTWKAKIINIDDVPKGFLLPDMVTLNRIARETKGKKRIPGVEFYED